MPLDKSLLLCRACLIEDIGSRAPRCFVSTTRKHRPRIHPRQPFDTHEIRLFALTPAALGLFAVDFGEERFEGAFELLVFGALVEFADEVAVGFEGAEGEGEGCVAEVLGEMGC